MNIIRDMIHHVVAEPVIYNAVQRLAGLEHTRRKIEPLFAETTGQVVLDVGAGTGLYFSTFPKSAKYLWFDRDPQKLRGFRDRTSAGITAVLGDGTQIGLRDKSVDYATCTAVSHHLTDPQFERLVSELARVVRKKLIFLDALHTDAWQSTLLWKYDRGSHPRMAETLTTAIEQCFTIEHIETFSVYHRYLLLMAKPH